MLLSFLLSLVCGLHEGKDLLVMELLQRYQEQGFRLIYWPRVGTDPKGWKGPTAKGWNAPETTYPIELYDPSVMNLGVITGHEVQPGRHLADVDLDWAGGLVMAAKLIPPTGFAMGRAGKKLSHAFFTTPTVLPLAAYDDIAEDAAGGWTGTGTRFVELRSGESTHQTMIAPSLHSPPNVKIELVLNGDILHLESEALQQAVLDYAIACLLLHRVPTGLHHDGRIALAGFLLHAGFSPERVIAIGEAVCYAQALNNVPEMGHRDVKDMSLCVKTTLARVSSTKKTTGAPTLAKFIGGAMGLAVIERIRLWLGEEDDFARDGKGHILARHQENIRRAVGLLNCTFSHNQFSDHLLMNGQPMEDGAVNAVYLQIEEKYHFSPPIEYFHLVIKNLCRANQFHPVKQYLESLTWDGTPRIDTWMMVAGKAPDTPYVRAISAIMLIAAVRRVRSPGCKYDEMVVFEAPQGWSKSTAVQTLCPDAKWFSDDLQLNARSQQLIEATLGKWIVEASDLAGKRKTEIEQLKAMMSRQVDGPVRMAYKEYAIERPRHFILVGTTNSSVYLTDPTGSRRFWPVRVDRFNIDWLIANRDQLWAEAAHREAQGESIHLHEDLWPAATSEQEKRREVDAWETIIQTELDRTETHSDGKKRIIINKIWELLGIPIERRDRSGSLRISDIMHKLGYERKRMRTPEEETPVWGFRSLHFASQPSPDAEDVEDLDQPTTKTDPDVPF